MHRNQLNQNSQIPIPKHRPVQVRFQQPKDIQLHVFHEIPHPPLTIPACIVDSEMDRPNACVQESATRVCGGGRRGR